MEWKNQLTKTPYLVLFIILISAGVGTASALMTITLAGDVTITGVTTLLGDLMCTDCIHDTDIAANAVGALEIAANAVGASEIATNAVGKDEIQNNAVGDGELAVNSVGSSEIQANAVTTSKIAGAAVGTSDIAPNAVQSYHIAADVVGLSEIDVTITTYTANLLDDTITMIPVDGKSFCALLKAQALDSSGAQCDIDFASLSNWELQAITAGAICQAICIQFG